VEVRQTYESPFIDCLESAPVRLKGASLAPMFLEWVGTALSADWMRP